MKDVKNKIKKQQLSLIFVVFALFITVLFFSVSIYVTVDSTVYYNYLKIMNGIEPISSWDVTRGPSLPLVLFIFSFIFGKTMFAILLASYVYFTAFILIAYKLLKYILTKFTFSKKKNTLIWSLFLLFFVFNPILFGYFHNLLTEFIAIPIAFFSCALAWKWLDVDFYKNRKEYICYVTIFVFLTIFSWFLKQPYVTIALLPLIISIILSIINNHKFKNVIQRVAALVFCILLLSISVFGWRQFLSINGADYDNNRNNQGFLSKGILMNISSARVDSRIHKDIVNSLKSKLLISKADKEKILSIYKNPVKNKEFDIYDILSFDGKTIDTMVFFHDSANIKISESFNFWLKVVKKHPMIIIDSQVSNYLAISDLIKSGRSSNGDHFPIKEIGADKGFENKRIALQYLNYDNNFQFSFFLNDSNITDIYSKGESGNLIKFIFGHTAWLFNIVYRLLMFLLPIIFIYTIIKYKSIFKSKNKRLIKMFNLIIILLGFSLAHILAHTFLGAIIDRYAYVVFPEILFAILMLIASFKDVKKNK